MTVEEITRVRNLAGNKIIKVFCDNALICNAGKIKGSEFIWDDTNNMFYNIIPSVSHTQKNYPAEIIMCSYDMIQHMVIMTTYNETIKFLQDVGKTEVEIDSIIENLDLL
jgi:hypothetical protein